MIDAKQILDGSDLNSPGEIDIAGVVNLWDRPARNRQ
jgi:hypothetical protein